MCVCWGPWSVRARPNDGMMVSWSEKTEPDEHRSDKNEDATTKETKLAIFTFSWGPGSCLLDAEVSADLQKCASHSIEEYLKRKMWKNEHTKI